MNSRGVANIELTQLNLLRRSCTAAAARFAWQIELPANCVSPETKKQMRSPHSIHGTFYQTFCIIDPVGNNFQDADER